LTFLKAKNIIHRDLHPGNILLDESTFFVLKLLTIKDGLKLKIIDFGVSVKLDKSQDKFEGVQGHENFRAPEMLNDLKYNQKIDIWALGIILYMCVCGRHPFIAKF